MKIIECPRDAMQGLQKHISTDLKVKYINALLKVGFDTLDFGSFVSPAAVPQMKDTESVLEKIDHLNNTKLLAIIVNYKGAEQASKFSKISYLGYPFSISEEFQLRNTNKTINQSFDLLKDLKTLCDKTEKELVIYLSMAFGNPYKESWSLDLSYHWVEKLNSIGIKIVSLADTVGCANEKDIYTMFSFLSKKYPSIEFGVHLHTSESNWKTKLEAAYNGGCKRFDSAIGGFGGCPFAKDELVGNLSTQNLLQFLDEKMEKNNIDKNKLREAIKISSQIFA